MKPEAWVEFLKWQATVCVDSGGVINTVDTYEAECTWPHCRDDNGACAFGCPFEFKKRGEPF